MPSRTKTTIRYRAFFFYSCFIRIMTIPLLFLFRLLRKMSLCHTSMCVYVFISHLFLWYFAINSRYIMCIEGMVGSRSSISNIDSVSVWLLLLYYIRLLLPVLGCSHTLTMNKNRLPRFDDCFTYELLVHLFIYARLIPLLHNHIIRIT